MHNDPRKRSREHAPVECEMKSWSRSDEYGFRQVPAAAPSGLEVMVRCRLCKINDRSALQAHSHVCLLSDMDASHARMVDAGKTEGNVNRVNFLRRVPSELASSPSSPS